MAARTTSQRVQDVLLDDYGRRADGTYPNLAPRIRAANLLTSRVATAAAARGVTLSSDELAEIETWLAAHFYAVTDKPYESKTTEGAQAKFVGKTGMHLQSTHYGQTAMDLDWSGTLRAVGSEQRRSVGAFWLGKVPSEQIDYDQRD